MGYFVEIQCLVGRDQLIRVFEPLARVANAAQVRRKVNEVQASDFAERKAASSVSQGRKDGLGSRRLRINEVPQLAFEPVTRGYQRLLGTIENGFSFMIICLQKRILVGIFELRPICSGRHIQ